MNDAGTHLALVLAAWLEMVRGGRAESLGALLSDAPLPHLEYSPQNQRPLPGPA
jgi:hypothetical protein